MKRCSRTVFTTFHYHLSLASPLYYTWGQRVWWNRGWNGNTDHWNAYVKSLKTVHCQIMDS